ncbi:hypothetical protein O4215_11880 [Rhodococcus maanshanensis]|uniref:hypothetical protein n=1 Tax=Rhodococcus maanshanensis TaxID=183556 RepID=UPI0022B48514|nr:hypothetical protein [Rhodococcus maanshanensis]MCZ4556274.1 hypothetical protein [Rhodococcus maanshanensis]
MGGNEAADGSLSGEAALEIGERTPSAVANSGAAIHERQDSSGSPLPDMVRLTNDREQLPTSMTTIALIVVTLVVTPQVRAPGIANTVGDSQPPVNRHPSWQIDR